MASPIIAAVRHLDLKESVLHTCIELAHRASIYGVARVSYSYLALKCHCSRRTVIRHIQRLIDARVLKKSVLWIKGNFCEVNTYTFQIPWKKPAPEGGSDKATSKLPPQDTSEKYAALEDDIRQLAKGLRFCSPGSPAYEATPEVWTHSIK